MLPKQSDENPAGDRASERERSERQSYPPGQADCPPSIPQAQKISAPRMTLTIKAAADPPIAEIPMFLDPLPAFGRGRRSPQPDENRARWRFFSTARPAPALWKMPTTKNVIALLRPKSHINFYRMLSGLGTSTRFQLRRQETDANLFRSAFVWRAQT